MVSAATAKSARGFIRLPLCPTSPPWQRGRHQVVRLSPEFVKMNLETVRPANGHFLLPFDHGTSASAPGS
jgi:hypothetical protein